MELRIRKRALTLASVTSLLAACQMAEAPPTQPSQQQAVIQPAAQSQQVDLARNTSTTRVVNADGSIQTTTKSSSITIDTGSLFAANQSAPSRGDFLGSWTLRQPDGRTCSLTLRDGRPRGFVSKGGCFHDSVFFVSGWDLRGRNLVLTNAVGEELAVLRATGPNQLEAPGLILYR